MVEVHLFCRKPCFSGIWVPPCACTWGLCPMGSGRRMKNALWGQGDPPSQSLAHASCTSLGKYFFIWLHFSSFLQFYSLGPGEVLIRWPGVFLRNCQHICHQGLCSVVCRDGSFCPPSCWDAARQIYLSLTMDKWFLLCCGDAWNLPKVFLEVQAFALWTSLFGIYCAGVWLF